jgi:alkaline phosphatase
MGQIDNTDIAKTIFNFIDKKQPVKIDSNLNTVPKETSTNIELTSDEDDDGLCDFKEDWRCN